MSQHDPFLHGETFSYGCVDSLSRFLLLMAQKSCYHLRLAAKKKLFTRFGTSQVVMAEILSPQLKANQPTPPLQTNPFVSLYKTRSNLLNPLGSRKTIHLLFAVSRPTPQGVGVLVQYHAQGSSSYVVGTLRNASVSSGKTPMFRGTFVG